MIRRYLDKNCKVLRNSQDLRLENECSALWLSMEERSDLDRFLRFMVSISKSLDSFLWLAFSDGAGSHRMLELKRSFGHFHVSRSDVVSRHDSFDEVGNKLYSDIAQITNKNISRFISILGRSLFGTDSALFFLPTGTLFPSKNVAKPLTDLFVKRKGMKEICEHLLNQGLMESFIEEIMSMGGLATVILRDSNMKIIVVLVGHQFGVNQISKLMESHCSVVDQKSIISETELYQMLDVGVSITVFG